MAYIGKTPVIGNFVKLDSITVVNGQAAYTMQNGGVNFTSYDNVNQFLVSLNGVLQAPTDSFTVSGSTLTFASNLSTGDVIDFVLVLGNSLDIGTPSDNTVTSAKINYPLTTFSSTGIDDNADSTVITLTNAEDMIIGSATDRTSFLSQTSGNLQIKNGLIFESGSASTNNEIMTYRGNSLVFGISATEKMRIDSDGVVKFTNTPPIKSLDFGSCTVTLADNAFIDFPATSGFWVITETVMDKDYEILKQTDQGTLIQIEIDGKKHQTFAVCKRDNMEDANLDDVVEDFKQSIINPPTITPVDNSTEKASGKQKLLDLGLTEEEVKALIGI